MSPPTLKRLRVAVSLAFLVLLTAVALDFTGTFPPAMLRTMAAFQVLPSLQAILHAPAFLPIFGLLAIVILTLLFGRMYCSTLCPLGTLQDIVTFLARKAGRSGHVRLSRRSLLRYGILAGTLLCMVAGIMPAVLLLDPFSTYTRILAGLARPVLLGINNGAASALEWLGSFALYPVQMRGISWFSLSVPFLLLVLFSWLAWTRGRFFCSTICPAGTLLGCGGRFSLWKFRIDGDLCTGCGVCETVCKAGCIESTEKLVDMERCVACFNCLSACSTDGLQYTTDRRGSGDRREDSSRRRFLLGALTWMTLPGGVPRAQPDTTRVLHAATVPARRTTPVAPPGAETAGRFTARCTACHLCISACPSGVLVPAFLDYGVAGFLQPVLDSRAGFCAFECTRCTEVCPTGALRPLALDEKKLTRLGTAKVIKDDCIVYTEGTECGACSEHCPTKAVRMVPYRKLQAPEMHDEYCIGCGACEYACPTFPYKAIIVEGLTKHERAERPPRQKQLEPAGTGFPF